MNRYISVTNNTAVSQTAIPDLEYDEFLNLNTCLAQNEHMHCVAFFGKPENSELRLICGMADDSNATILLSSTLVNFQSNLPSLSAEHASFHLFEREIHENYGVNYTNHPWLKPVRWSYNRADQQSTMNNYPFYTIEGDELHEVGVGPIHAGIIEPGHFRFICDGEKVLHLEIHLGYQHRGLESLLIQKNTLNKQLALIQQIAGDTTVAHSTAFANLYESLAGYEHHNELDWIRTIAQELERVAVHTGDLSAICGDIAFQLGNAVFGRLRTPIINFTQNWCGNRLGRHLVRPGMNRFAFTTELRDELIGILDAFERDFTEMCAKLFNLPSALSRLERTGIFTQEQALETGAVGMVARSSGLNRDIRRSHPYGWYKKMPHQPVIKHRGDVYSRTQVRRNEVLQSLSYIRNLLDLLPQHDEHYPPLATAMPNALCISLAEGWRGEICHVALTGPDGEFTHYKIKDPSFHNWMALALAVRNNEISDFPLCNKSFNLSYSGYDL